MKKGLSFGEKLFKKILYALCFELRTLKKYLQLPYSTKYFHSSSTLCFDKFIPWCKAIKKFETAPICLNTLVRDNTKVVSIWQLRTYKCTYSTCNGYNLNRLKQVEVAALKLATLTSSKLKVTRNVEILLDKTATLYSISNLHYQNYLHCGNIILSKTAKL